MHPEVRRPEEQRIFQQWANDWGGVFKRQSEIALRCCPTTTFAVIVWRDDQGVLVIEEFTCRNEMERRRIHPKGMPWAYCFAWRDDRYARQLM